MTEQELLNAKNDTISNYDCVHKLMKTTLEQLKDAPSATRETIMTNNLLCQLLLLEYDKKLDRINKQLGPRVGNG